MLNTKLQSLAIGGAEMYWMEISEFGGWEHRHSANKV